MTSFFQCSRLLAYGLLCTAVGYFAPAPPRSPAAGLEQPA